MLLQNRLKTPLLRYRVDSESRCELQRGVQVPVIVSFGCALSRRIVSRTPVTLLHSSASFIQASYVLIVFVEPHLIPPICPPEY